MIIVKLGILRF